ncbi:hypothetical protein GQ457_09G017730 [Hibiscus cannabinus]
MCSHQMVRSKSWRKFEDKSFSRRGDDVSTSSSARVADPEFLPQGPVTHSKAKQFKEALSHTFLDEDAANSSNFMAAIDAFLKHSSSSSFENMFTSILTSRRYKEARFTGSPIVDPEVLPQGPITRSDVSTSAPAPIVDPEVLPQGPITRSKAKQFREALFLTCAKLSDSFDINCALEHKYVNVLHTDVEIKGHDIMDLSSARLKFRSLYAARFNSTKCHTSAS